jgi:hypothetical protein
MSLTVAIFWPLPAIAWPPALWLMRPVLSFLPVVMPGMAHPFPKDMAQTLGYVGQAGVATRHLVWLGLA